MADFSVPKPGDLLIGVIDFFAILIPGVLVALIFASMSKSIPETPDSIFYSKLLVAGFVLGHIVHGVGSILDPLLYDRYFKPRDPSPIQENEVDRKTPDWLVRHVRRYLRRNDALYSLAKSMMTASLTVHVDTRTEVAIPGGMYQWARAFLRTHSPEATAELDRLEADSKLFRSLVVVIPLYAYAHWRDILTSNGWQAVFIVLGLAFSLWRYCDLRQKMVRACYLHYVQARSERIAAAQRA